RLRLRPCDDRGAGTADSRGQGDDRQPARLARAVVTPDRRRAQGRPAREPELDRVRAGGRDRLPHLHGVRARPVRRALLRLPAGPNAESPTRRAPLLAQGRVPGLSTFAFALADPRYGRLGWRAGMITSALAAWTSRSARPRPTGNDQRLQRVGAGHPPPALDASGSGRPRSRTRHGMPNRIAREQLAGRGAVGFSPLPAARPGPPYARRDRGTRHPSPGVADRPHAGVVASSREEHMAIAFPGESAEYRAARNRLLDQEIELRRAMEAVAEARRRLAPGGGVAQD